MKRSFSLLSVLLAAAILIAACTPAAAPTATSPVLPTAEATQTQVPPTATLAPEPTETAAPETTPTTEPIVVLDGEGNEFQLAAPAQRVISLAPSNTEMLFAVGAGSQVIAREDFSNYPEEAAALPSVGGNMGTYNLEQIASLEPDLILASPLTAPDALKSLLDITPSVLVVPNPKNLEEMYLNIVKIGTLTGHRAEAEELTVSLIVRVRAIDEKLKGVTEKPMVFYELDATDPAKPWTSGPGTFIDQLITRAGGQNVGASLTGEWAQISQEELIVQDPAIILLGDALYGGVTPEAVAARPGWAAISAVVNQQVFVINDDLVSRPGPRNVDGLEELAKTIHPELFEE